MTYGNKNQIIKELQTVFQKQNEFERRKLLKNIAISLLPDYGGVDLPLLPKDRLQWEYHCRPIIKGKPNRLKYLPMMHKPITDDSALVMWRWARQWGKTTSNGSELGYNATTKHNFDQMYLAPTQPILETFTENKFRQDVWGKGILSNFISTTSKLGSMNRIVTYLLSTITMNIPGKNWVNTQGGSNKLVIVDEHQDHNYTGIFNLYETLIDVRGKVRFTGIGSDEGSGSDNLWLATNMQEWEFKKSEKYHGFENSSWRKGLDYDKDGLVYGDYMIDVEEGQWNITNNDCKQSYAGYHLSQLQNPRIPLTRKDAVELYKIPASSSIESRMNDINYSKSEYIKNILAETAESEARLFSKKLMESLFKKGVYYTRPEDVDFTLGRVFIGGDWGGLGKTVITIWQCLDEEKLVFQLLYAKMIMTADPEEQIDIFLEYVKQYQSDFTSFDSGGGTYHVNTMHKKLKQLSIRISYKQSDEKPQPTSKEFRKNKKQLLYSINKQFSIDRIRNLMSRPFVKDGNITPRIILPGEEKESMQWFIDQFTVEEIEIAYHKSSGARYKRYFTPDGKPDDALHSSNYAITGFIDVCLNQNRQHLSSNINYSVNDSSFDIGDMTVH